MYSILENPASFPFSTCCTVFSFNIIAYSLANTIAYIYDLLGDKDYSSEPRRLAIKNISNFFCKQRLKSDQGMLTLSCKLRNCTYFKYP